MCRAENKASNHRSAKLHPGRRQRGFSHVEPANTASAGAPCHTLRPQAVQRRPWRAGRRWGRGSRVSKHSPTILTAGKPEMYEKKKKKKKSRWMERCSISPPAGRSNSCRAPASNSASLGGKAGENKPSLCLQPPCPAIAARSL